MILYIFIEIKLLNCVIQVYILDLRICCLIHLSLFEKEIKVSTIIVDFSILL